MLWIVTKSAHYYPDDGVGDWISVHNDETKARVVFEAIELDSWNSVYLLCIQADLTFEQVDCRDGEKSDILRTA